MKKIFTVFFALLSSVGTIFAESGTCGDNLTWNLTNGVLTIFGTGEMYDYEYIKENDNVNVTNPWYSQGYNIASIIISDGVTSIGDYAFYGCEGLTSVTIPNSVTSIGDGSFGACESLLSVTIPNSVTSIGLVAFYGCTGLTSPVYNVHVFAFMPTSYSGAYSIPNGIETISGYAFASCTGLTEVTIPNSVISVGMAAFYGCTGLTSVTIPNGVTSIGDYAFAFCTGLTSVTIPNSVTNIGSVAFGLCTSLISVTLPNSVISVGMAAFYGCTGLTSVTIPNSVTNIGESPFESCSNLTDIYATCGDLDRVKELLNNDSRVQYPSLPYNILTVAQNGDINTNLSELTICDEPFVSCYATPDYGYHFTQWADGDTNNPRIITLTQDTTMEAIFALNTYNMSVTCNIKQGSIEGENGEFDYMIEKSYKAISKYGYHFVQWSDSVYVCDNGWEANCWNGHWEKITDNPRTIVITRDTAISAIFVPNTYTIVDNSDLTRGRINGVGSFDYLSQLELTAIPVRGYQFIRWADGNTDNPRMVELTQDTTMEAIFNYLLTGKCGKDNALTWTLDTTTMALNITGQGALSENYTYGTFIESLTIGNDVTQIGHSAFDGFMNLKNVILGSSVKVLEKEAFDHCEAIESITCYSQRPPTVNERALYGLDYSTIVYVPAEYLETYKMHDAWGLYDVRPLGAIPVETNDVQVEPAETTATVAWPAVSGAATYELVIKDKSGNVICTLIFNANGQLTQIAFNAPSREQSAGFSFTVTGLEEGKSYDLTITAKNDSGATLDEKTVSFTTTGSPTEGLNQIVNDQLPTPHKVFRNGQILILRGNRTYTLTGAEVK